MSVPSNLGFLFYLQTLYLVTKGPCSIKKIKGSNTILPGIMQIQVLQGGCREDFLDVKAKLPADFLGKQDLTVVFDKPPLIGCHGVEICPPHTFPLLQKFFRSG